MDLDGQYTVGWALRVLIIHWTFNLAESSPAKKMKFWVFWKIELRREIFQVSKGMFLF